jgi:hypothetical protein
MTQDPYRAPHLRRGGFQGRLLSFSHACCLDESHHRAHSLVALFGGGSNFEHGCP